MKTILYISTWIMIAIVITIHFVNLNNDRNNREFSRKLFETSYKAGQVNEAYKNYMFRVKHEYMSDSLYKADSAKIDSMICNYF